MDDCHSISLDGDWEAGIDRRYDRTVRVPGLAGDPAVATPGTLWYCRRIELPAGTWTHATLVLNGARFCPSVYVDGQQVSASGGGMTATTHSLGSPSVRPGAQITLEIALCPLDEVEPQDASKIPSADRWRSNVASCLWDSVTLRLHGDAHIDRLLAWMEGDQVVVRYGIHRHGAIGRQLFLRCGEHVHEVDGDQGTFRFAAPDLPRWSPEYPALCTMEAALVSGNDVLDERRQYVLNRSFAVHDRGFVLNGRPARLRGGTLVWHRWVRDPEGRQLAWDAEWFEKNILLRLKSHGANAIRFHLGMPPEGFLDLCDRHGMMVQAEWHFFHGMEASRQSLLEQWQAWLDLCLRHPSVCILHPWNETEGLQLARAFGAIEDLAGQYPPLVLSHRDVIHVHKYWWSLFENLGLYYDSAEQFPKPVVADEFGGNYLDGDANPGKYPTVAEAFVRFLGANHTKDLRLQLQSEANSQVAEYWRRIGVAGFSPFCIAGSREDGNHWFLGPLKEANPKPVWDALTAAWSPQSVSLEIWDRNFEPSQPVEVPLHLFNDTGEAGLLKATVRVHVDGQDELVDRFAISADVPAHEQAICPVPVIMPPTESQGRIEARLENPPQQVTRPVVSSWRVRTIKVRVPPPLRRASVWVDERDRELAALARRMRLNRRAADEADVLLLSSEVCRGILATGEGGAYLAGRLEAGRCIVVLDLGPRWMGENDLPMDKRNLQGQNQVRQPRTLQQTLFAGVRVEFRETPEPESHLHAAGDGSPAHKLWWNLDRQATWLWNGLRGGLIVPSADMEVLGLSPDALLAAWTQRGADADMIRAGTCIAWELGGFFGFAAGDDAAVKEDLRRRVRFLVDDAPALASSINPDAPIRTLDLGAMYRAAAGGQAQGLVPLARCGKNLSRTPVVMLEFGPGRGRLVLSQLLTAGRLAHGFGTGGLYGVRYDPAAAQFVLNLASTALDGC